MITRSTKASSVVLGQVADFVLGNATYMRQEFPQCTRKEEVLAELAKSTEQWNVFATDRPGALFTLHFSGMNAILNKFLPATTLSFDGLISSLQHDFEEMKIESLIINAPEEMADALKKNGFEKGRLLIKLAGPVLETKLMPILALSSPTESDIPPLAKLMRESYDKSQESKFQNVSSAERLLRDIMLGSHGPYVAEASLVSGAIRNAVSACFITLSSPREANVTQLFTHPLYRARGLATTEVATAMNKLVKRGVQTLTVRVAENNEVARRLFTKLGFKEDRRLVEMVTRFQ